MVAPTPIRFTCPQCLTQLAADVAGAKRARCPKCGAAIGLAADSAELIESPAIDQRPLGECPRCSSHETQRVAVIHAQGSSLGSLVGAAGSFTNRDLFPTIGGALGRQQTELARNLAPPPPPSNKWPLEKKQALFVLLVGVVIGFIGLLTLTRGTGWDRLAGLPILAVGVALTYGAMKLSARHTLSPDGLRTAVMQHNQQIAEWNRSWFCNRCGTTFLEGQ